MLLWTKGFPSGSAPQAVSSFVSIGGSVGPLPVPWLDPCAASSSLAALALVLAAGANALWPATLCARQQSGRAAPLALINPVAMWIVTFALSAFFAALAGVLLLGFTGSAYGDVGQPYLFQTIAAVVIGGTSLIGGRGSYVGTLAGAVALTEINTLLIGLGLQPSMVQAALGVDYRRCSSRSTAASAHVSHDDLTFHGYGNYRLPKLAGIARQQPVALRDAGSLKAAHGSPPPRSRGRRRACRPASRCPRRRDPSRMQRWCVRHRAAASRRSSCRHRHRRRHRKS